MGWKPLRERLDNLPLVLAGPIVRRVDSRSVTVWVALKQSQRVILKVFDLDGQLILQGDRETVQLGINLHVVAVTAAVPRDLLVYGNSYLYDLEFAGGKGLGYPGVINGNGDIADIAYPPYQSPSFALVPRNLNDVRLVHGSCRKPHGESLDAFAGIDKMIREALQVNPAQRPHQLFLTGDQIYADDVADALLFMLLDAGEVLFGWQEQLPDVTDITELAPGKRNRVATETAGLTASITKLNRISQAAKSHLMRFSEFACMYLFAWSDVLWVDKQDFPTRAQVYPLAPTTKQHEFEQEVEDLKKFAIALKSVRRSLANIPTYMIFDDHEVTDDWYLNFAWCDRVLRKPLGVRVIQNGLLAYALFQAWGNTPQQFVQDQPGGALLTAVKAWCALQGNNDTCNQEILHRLGIASFADIQASQPRRLPVSPDAIRWSYTVLTPSYCVLVLDTRTNRDFPGQDFDFPGLISQEGCKQQLADLSLSSHVDVTIIISPSPVIGLPFLEGIQRVAKNITAKFGVAAWAFDPEAWALQTEAFERFLAELAKGAGANSRIVILSGDVHYSFGARMQYAISQTVGKHRFNTQMVVAQFTSSSFKNEDSSIGGSHALHHKGFIPIEQIRHSPQSKILGWENPNRGKLQIGYVSHFDDGGMVSHPWVISGNPAKINLECDRAWFRVLEITRPPQWYYRIDFLPGKPESVEPLRRPQILPVVAPLPKQPRQQALAVYLGNAKKPPKKYQEVVGVNNFGEITFEFSKEKQIATQTLWWRLESRDEQTLLEPFPLSQCDISLNFDDEQYPFSDVMREIVI